MKQRFALIVLLPAILAAAAHCARAADEKPVWLAVTTPLLEPALKPLVEKRASEGFETVVSTKPVDKAIAGLPRKPSFVLIVGDYETGNDRQPWNVAAKKMKLYRWRAQQREEYASDAAWGDLDGDLVPEVPVGRIPARTRDEASLVVTKILAYEKSEPGVKDLRLPIWTGTSLYGPLIDGLASSMLLSKTQMGIPAWCEARLICGDVNSPFCGWPQEQPAVFNRELQQGCLMAAMMGHADREAFLSLVTRTSQVKYTIRDAETGLAKGEPTGPVFIFSCFTGDFTGSRCCLAEMMLGSPGGPVAVVAATTESHPLPNYFSGVSLLDTLSGKEKRIGALWLDAQRAAREANDPVMEQMLANLEGKLEAEINIEKLRRDQLFVYEILGDPATPRFLPEPLEATVVRKGNSWHWKAVRPDGAKDLHVGFRAEIPAASANSAGGQANQMRAAFKTANDGLGYESLESPKPGAPWEGSVNKPGFVRLVATGPGVLRVAVLGLRAEPGVSGKPAR